MRSLMFTLVVGSFCLMAGCQKVELKEFSPDGTFKVLMPEKKQQKDQDFGGLQGKTWIAEYNDGALYVAAAILPEKKIDAALSDMMLKEGIKAMMTQTNAKLIKETEIKLDNEWPGREVEASLKVPKKSGGGEVDGIVKIRAYIADGKMFIVQALGKPDWIAKPEIGQFLDSLHVIKK